MRANLRLRDGRSLAWRMYGAENGFPIVFFHGNLNSRLFEPAWDATQAATEAAGARVIAVDRPGYGLSDYVGDDSVLATAARTTKAVINALGVSSFGVVGLSAGGPFAAACLARTALRKAPPIFLYFWLCS